MTFDAVVVGSGPNGFGAAITLARAGHSVCLIEGAETIGGGMRSFTTPDGAIFDYCAAVHPLGISSPVFKALRLERYGLEWAQPAVPMAHPFDDGSAATLCRSADETAEQFGGDGRGYKLLIGSIVNEWPALAREILQPIVHVPRKPILLGRFGTPSLLSASLLGKTFGDERLSAMIAGSAAHSVLPPTAPLTASFGMVLAIAGHAVGWPFVAGGTQNLANTLAACFRDLGGEIRTGTPVRSLDDLPPHRVALFDVSPEAILEICGDRLSGRYRDSLIGFKRGPAVFKVDFLLSGPVPWKSPEARNAGTVHLAGDMAQLRESTNDVHHGRVPERPFVVAAQPSQFDPGRAPAGRHTFWAYCHVPAGSDVDMTPRIEAQVERFAPGFRDLIVERHVFRPGDLEAHNPNLVGGDITGGSNGGLQLFFRPRMTLRPYNTSDPDLFLCSSSTPPGGGVHGMAGYHAAKAALKRLRG